MMRILLILIIVAMSFSCTMLEPGMYDPDRPRFEADESNIIPAPSEVFIVPNGDYINTWEVHNASKTFSVMESLDYVSLDGGKEITINETGSHILSVSGAPSGYRFWIYPYTTLIYEVQ